MPKQSMSTRDDTCVDWAAKYGEYFYTDRSDPKCKKVMAKPGTPTEALESFKLWKRINNITY